MKHKTKTGLEIALVDSETLMRRSLSNLINKHSEHSVLLEARNLRELMGLLEQTDKEALPEIIVACTGERLTYVYGLVGHIKTQYPGIKLVLLSTCADAHFITELIRKGLDCFLPKTIEFEELLYALSQVKEKGAYYDPSVRELMVMNYKDQDEYAQIVATFESLGVEYKEFLKLICTDLPYLQIAKKMHKATKTVEGYRGNMFKLFKVRSRVGLVLILWKNQLVIPA